MCECDECSPRCTAKAVSIISLVFACLAMISVFGLMMMALDVYRPDHTKSEHMHRTYWLCRQIGATVFIITFLLLLGSAGLDILLFLACDKQRVIRDKKQCFIWAMIWLVVSVLGLISGFVMGGMLSNHGEHGGHPIPVIHLLLIALVVPYVVQLSRPGAVIVQPAQVNPSQMQNPNMYNTNPSVGGYPQSQVVVVGYPPQQGYPQQGGYPQVGGYPQLQQPMSTPTQQGT